MKRHLPALLVLSLSAAAWSCGSDSSNDEGSTAGSAHTGAAGSLGAAGSAGKPSTAAGSAGTPDTAGGSGGTVGSAAGSAGSATGGTATAGATNGGAANGGAASAGRGNAGAPNSSAGASGTTGASGAGAGGSDTAGASGMCKAIANTATRPQLSSTDASKYTIQKYLAQSDNWDPTAGLASASSFTPSFTVAADGSGTHTTVQAALNAATGTARRYILIKPGSYRGAVSYSGSTPVTLYGLDSDASKVVIVNDQSASSAGGTGKSATFTSKSSGLELLNLTVSNDFATPVSGTNIQAVALYVMGDKTVLQNVRLHGFQDTLFTDLASESAVTRVYIKNSFIEGDTDFIFGAATLVIDDSNIHYLSSRKSGGACLAPSTRVSQNYGFLVINSQLTADAGAGANKVSLGRSWDQGGVTPTPNGQAVLRECVIGAHVRKADPWAAAATSSRAFSATGNRFSEYCNSGTGAGP